MVHQVFNSIGSHIYNGIIYESKSFDYNFHNSFELLYIFKGCPCSMVSTNEINLCEGTFLLIAPNMAHRLYDTENSRFYVGVFSSDFVSEFIKTSSILPYYKFTVDNSTETFLKSHLLYTGTPDLYTLKGCLYTICANAVQSVNSDNLSNVNTSFVLDVNNYIEQNLKNSFSRKDIANALNYEEHYFSTLFNKTFNIGFNKYVNVFRFVHAQKLLTTTKQSMSYIAHECGFASIQSFNRNFKELSGKTPTEYRHTEILVTEPDVMNQRIVVPKL